MENEFLKNNKGKIFVFITQFYVYIENYGTININPGALCRVDEDYIPGHCLKFHFLNSNNDLPLIANHILINNFDYYVLEYNFVLNDNWTDLDREILLNLRKEINSMNKIIHTSFLTYKEKEDLLDNIEYCKDEIKEYEKKLIRCKQ